MAKDHGAYVIGLAPQKEFSSARARNVGVTELRRVLTDVAYMQYIDDDWALGSHWLSHRQAALTEDSDLVVVCGRLGEIDLRVSMYNRVCDPE